MKRNLSIIIILLLCVSCASTKLKEIKPNELPKYNAILVGKIRIIENGAIIPMEEAEFYIKNVITDKIYRYLFKDNSSYLFVSLPSGEYSFESLKYYGKDLETGNFYGKKSEFDFPQNIKFFVKENEIAYLGSIEISISTIPEIESNIKFFNDKEEFQKIMYSHFKGEPWLSYKFNSVLEDFSKPF